MSMYPALLIVLGFFAFGDFLGVITKAKLSSVFVALMLFLVLFVTGVLPADLIEVAGLRDLSRMSLGFLVFNMGSTVNLSQMKREWKIVVMAIFSMLIAVAAVYLVSPIIGREEAIVSIPIINGGLAATQIMTQAAMDKGFASAAALGTVIFAVQKFVGTIPASRCGLSEANILVKEYREKKAAGTLELEEAVVKGEGKGKKEPFYKKHQKYYTTYMTLGITAFALFFCDLIAKATGVSISIWSLLAGMTFNQLGLVPPGILDQGKSSGLFMVASFASLIPSLAKISVSDLSQMAVQTVIIFGVVIVAIFGIMYFLPTWKLVGSRNLAIGIAMSQLLGFPATLLIVNEVATAAAQTPEEREYVVKKLTPAFVVSGFVSVTTISILIAGVFASFI
ncbi:MAG: hypothetical protein QM221_07125 [Bacillota bacterium]|nr:hypothetical protein [Bacillota bacterium]